uniref:PX domain-containing protein n=1 Tax=Octactis speculum TaxID=3111310 RepID=A0A7S2AXV1_9STRA|mmetsp:Transcript_17279/g.23249  ORF Transcript_17279/g.23249 Transcript_17279/m.23249 type:complete len:289 (+) Transcript_17279:365-1231(+)
MLLIATPMWNWRSGRGASFNQDSRLSYFDHMMLGPQTKIIELPETHLNQTALRVSNGKEKIIAFLANTRFAELILKSVAYVLGRRSTKVQIMRSDVSLQMFIASYSTMEVTPSSFRVFYNLQLVGPKGRIKNIAKRYSELRNFHNSLRRNYASQCTLPPFPAKEAMTAKRPETIIAERILMLGHYLTALHALGNESIEKEMCVFFGNVDVSWMGHKRPDAPKQLEPGPKTHFESDPKTNFESGPKPHFESDTNNVPPIYTGPQPPPRPCLAQPDTATDDKNVKFELEN